MSSSRSPRDLVYGLVAVKLRFLTADELISAVQSDVDNAAPGHEGEADSIGRQLIAQGVLSAADDAAIDQIVQRHLSRHGDPEQSLAALTETWAGQSDTDPLAKLEGTEIWSLDTAPVNTGDSGPRHPVRESGASRFQVISPHAEGGLGVVSLARDKELNRNVALKEIKPRRADDKVSQAFFEREAMITGNLEHPGIVPVYGFGRYTDGKPFYAMRFIEGRSLKEAIDAFHGIGRDDPQRNLAFRELLDRFVDICQAIEFAHSKGVIHRDIKPANVMLGAFGETLVVDWGLASAEQLQSQDETVGPEVTLAGGVFGTPAYAPPEQCTDEMEADAFTPRSDVYSLGATLLSVLSGKVPVEGADLAEVIANVNAGRTLAQQPSTSGAPAPLWAVCRKAMSVDPTQRYASAKALAREVERYLADEPVEAMPEPWIERARRWTRKHPRTSVGLGLSLLLITVFLGLGFAVVSHLNGKLVVARSSAERNFEEAKKAVETYLVLVTDDKRLNAADLTTLRSELLTSAIPFYERLAAYSTGDDQVEYIRAETRHRLANLRSNTGDVVGARSDYEAAFTALQQLFEAHPRNDELQHAVALVQFNYGDLLEDLGEHERAKSYYQQSLASIEDLAKRDAKLEYLSDAADVAINLGVMARARNDYETATANFRRAIGIYERSLVESAINSESVESLAWAHYQVASTLRQDSRLEEAASECRKAIELCRELGLRTPDVTEALVANLNQLAANLNELGRVDEADKTYREAIPLAEELTNAFPSVYTYQTDVAFLHQNLAISLAGRSEMVEAGNHFRTALKHLKAAAGMAPGLMDVQTDLADGYHNYANQLNVAGYPEEAAKHYQEALNQMDSLAASEKGLPSYREGRARTLVDFGFLLLNRDVEAAREKVAEGVSIRKRLAEEYPDQLTYQSALAAGHQLLADCFYNSGDYEQAREHRELAFDIYQKLEEASVEPLRTRELIATAYLDRGDWEREAGRLEESIVNYDLAIDQLMQLFQASNLVEVKNRLLQARSSRSIAVFQQGNVADAERELFEVVSERMQLAAEHDNVIKYKVALAETRNDVAAMFLTNDRVEEAIEQLQLSLRGYELIAQREPKNLSRIEDVISTSGNLAVAYLELGNLSAAEQVLKKALVSGRKTLETSPEAPAWFKQSVSTVHGNLGDVYSAAEKFDDAEREYRVAVSMNQELLKSGNKLPRYQKNMGVALSDLATHLWEVEQFEEARKYFAQALDAQQFLTLQYPGNPDYKSDLAVTCSNFAWLMFDEGAYRGARRHLERALEIRIDVATRSPEPLYLAPLAEARIKLAYFYEEQDELEEVARQYQDAIKSLEPLADTVTANQEVAELLTESHLSLGESLSELGQLARAEDAMRRAIAIRDANLKLEPKSRTHQAGRADALSSLGNLLAKQMKVAAAEQAFKDAIALQEPLLESLPDSFDGKYDLAYSLAAYSELLLGVKRAKEALPLLQRCLALRIELAEEDPDYAEDVAEARRLLANCQAQLGDPTTK